LRVRGLTLNGRSPRRRAVPVFLILGPVSGALAPRNVRMEQLTQVPLRDLALEAQYAEIREALAKYSAPKDAGAGEGESECAKCGKVSPEALALCECGAFLHAARVFTCPTCTGIVAREARDCEGCGASFWSPVNPPESALTNKIVGAYLAGLKGL